MERDDLIVDNQYCLDAKHSEEEGKATRKKVWIVTVILSVITIVEVALGIMVKKGTDMWPLVKWGFIIMTIVKAGYIVMEFMHLGHERKNLKIIILAPYIAFIFYLIFICLTEAGYQYDLLQMLGWN